MGEPTLATCLVHSSLIALGLCLCLAAARPTDIPSHSLNGYNALLELHEAKAALAYSELQLVRHQALTKEVQLKSAAQVPPQPRPTQNTHAPAHTAKPQVSNQKMPSASHGSTRSSGSSICDSVLTFGMFLLFFKLVGKMCANLCGPTSLSSASNSQCASSRRPSCGAWKVGRGLVRIVFTIASVYYFSHVLLFLLSVGAVLTSLFICAIPTMLMVLMLAIPLALGWRYMNSQPRSMVWQIVQPVASCKPEAPLLLQRGDRGAGVAQLQSQLIQLGYMEPNAIRYGAGMFGPFTQEAICQVQRRMGIQPTGQYDSTTKGSLQKQLTQISKGAANQAGHENTTDQTQTTQKQAQSGPSNLRQGMCCVKPMHRARRGSATQITITPDAQQAMLVHAAQNKVHAALARAAVNRVTQLDPNSHPVANQEWKGIWCDVCKVSPIVGSRFTKQLQHDTYDLCQDCVIKQSAADQASFTEAVHVQAKKQNKQKVSTQLTKSQQSTTKQVSGNQVSRAHRDGEAYPLTGSGDATKNMSERIVELGRVKPVTSIFPVEWQPMVRDLQEMGFAQQASQAMVTETNGSLREAVKRLVAAERLS